MAEKKLFFTVGADIAPGSKAFSQLARDAKKGMGDVDTAVDDTRTNAQRVSDALGAVFDQLDADMAQAKASADALATAMGPELAAKVDTSVVVGEFSKLGLSLEEIEAEADTLVAALKRADDVSLKHFTGETDRMRGSLDGVRSSSDQSRSVLANMVGNSAQDMGALAGAAGAAGVAIGQAAEYAADGNINLSSFVKLAGPMVVLGGAVMLLQSHMKSVAETKAFHRAQVDGFTDALEDAKVTAKELADVLAGDADEGFMVRMQGETRDIIPELNRLGLSFEDVQRIIEGGNEEFDKWASGQLSAAAAAGASESQLANLSSALRIVRDEQRLGYDAAQAQGDGFTNTISAALGLSQAIDNLGIAENTQAERAKFHGETLDENATATEGLATANQSAVSSVDAHSAALGVQNAQQAEAQALIAGVTEALLGLVDANRSAADATIAAEDAQREFSDAALATVEAQAAQAEATAEVNRLTTEGTTDTDEYRAAVDDIESSTRTYEDAVRSERDAMIAAADAAVALKDEQSAASGTTQSATSKLDTFNDTLLANATYATPAARTAISNYIIEANNVPASKATEIRAAVERGDFDTAKRLLNEASASRTAAIKADADTYQANRDLDNAARARTSTITATMAPGGRDAARAGGGTVGIGENTTLVGEQGPELVHLPPGAHVFRNSESRSMGPSGGDTFNITLETGTATVEQAVAAIKKWEWQRRMLGGLGKRR